MLTSYIKKAAITAHDFIYSLNVKKPGFSPTL